MKKSAFYISIFLGLMLSVMFQNCDNKKTSKGPGIQSFRYEMLGPHGQKFVLLNALTGYSNTFSIDLTNYVIEYLEDSGLPGPPTTLVQYPLTTDEVNTINDMLDEAQLCRGYYTSSIFDLLIPRAHAELPMPRLTYSFINDTSEESVFDDFSTLCVGNSNPEPSPVFDYMWDIYNDARNGARPKSR